jgi:hypothetical protein
MHTDIDYSNLEGDAKVAKALEDIVNWLGWTKFTEISRIAHDDGVTWRQFWFACGIAGISGYPVRAWWLHLGNQPDPSWAKEDQGQ